MEQFKRDGGQVTIVWERDETTAETRIADLEKALSDLMAWGVEHDNPGLGYITVQVDRAAIEQACILLKGRN
jgi:hypothetical protein